MTSDPHQEIWTPQLQIKALVITVSVETCKVYLPVCSYPLFAFVLHVMPLSSMPEDSWVWINPTEFPPWYCCGKWLCNLACLLFLLYRVCTTIEDCPRVIQPCALLSINTAFINQKDECFRALYIRQEDVVLVLVLLLFHCIAFQHITFLLQNVVWL